MYRTTLNDLAFTLDNIEELKPLAVPVEISEQAKVALERMLAIAG
jgi:quinolinate synthase